MDDLRSLILALQAIIPVEPIWKIEVEKLKVLIVDRSIMVILEKDTTSHKRLDNMPTTYNKEI